jgi:hypothetical protein
MFIHSVYFWLANPESDADRAALQAGLESLRGVDAIQAVSIGTPANTRRPVIDHSYDFALLLTFTDEAAHDVYQDHAVHLAFVDTCRHLWSRVQIYDIETPSL